MQINADDRHCFYHLRVSREDFGNVKRQQQSSKAAAAKRSVESAKPTIPMVEPNAGNDQDPKDSETNSSGVAPSGFMLPSAPAQQSGPRQPWELVDEVMNTLKTAYPASRIDHGENGGSDVSSSKALLR